MADMQVKSSWKTSCAKLVQDIDCFGENLHDLGLCKTLLLAQAAIVDTDDTLLEMSLQVCCDQKIALQRLQVRFKREIRRRALIKSESFFIRK